MSGATSFEASRGLRRAATRLDWCVDAMAAQRTGESIEQGYLEAPKHAWMLSNLSLRHASAVSDLARVSRVYLPSGWVLARASLEASLRLAWLAEPDDVWEREARWVALMDEGVRFHKQISDELGEEDGLPFAGIADMQGEFARGVRQVLPSHVVPPRGIPSMETVARGQGDILYALYRTASQYTHGTDAAAWLYRRNLGINAEYGEFITDRMWVTVFNLAWQSARYSSLAIMKMTDVPLTLDLAALDQSIDEALRVLASGADGSSDD